MSNKDGGSAFPLPIGPAGDIAYQGMSLRDYFAIHAPEPTKDEIELQQSFDRNRNPHNDGPPKPPRRGCAEIRADLRYSYADAMLAARQKEER